MHHFLQKGDHLCLQLIVGLKVLERETKKQKRGEKKHKVKITTCLRSFHTGCQLKADPPPLLLTQYFSLLTSTDPIRLPQQHQQHRWQTSSLSLPLGVKLTNAMLIINQRNLQDNN